MSRLDSLAGLDSMVLHINTRSEPSPTVSTSISMDSESFVLVPRKRRQLGRASRTPLADKTPDFNTVCLQVSCIVISRSLNPVLNRISAHHSTLESLVQPTSRFRFIEIALANPLPVLPPAKEITSLSFLHLNHFRWLQAPRPCERRSWTSLFTLPLRQNQIPSLHHKLYRHPFYPNVLVQNYRENHPEKSR